LILFILSVFNCWGVVFIFGYCVDICVYCGMGVVMKGMMVMFDSGFMLLLLLGFFGG